MHDRVHAVFRELCRKHGAGGAVLEIGAVPDGSTLLALPELAGASPRVGINLAGPSSFGGLEIVGGNANAMPEFADGSFDLVLCNAVLEHDPKLWLTLGEIRRVLRVGGVAMIGVPGYVRGSSLGARLAGRLGRAARSAWLDGVAAGTPVLQVHDYPGDYYRFSEQAMREVFLDGFSVLEQRAVMVPPRLIGVGRKLG
jgi:SAM-dependent methyltransferase